MAKHIKDPFLAPKSYVQQRRMTADERAALRGVVREDDWEANKIASLVSGQSVAPEAKSTTIDKSELRHAMGLGGKRQELRILAAPCELDATHKSIKLAYNASFKAPSGADVVAYVDAHFPGSTVTAVDTSRRGIVALVIKAQNDLASMVVNLEFDDMGSGTTEQLLLSFPGDVAWVAADTFVFPAASAEDALLIARDWFDHYEGSAFFSSFDELANAINTGFGSAAHKIAFEEFGLDHEDDDFEPEAGANGTADHPGIAEKGPLSTEEIPGTGKIGQEMPSAPPPPPMDGAPPMPGADGAPPMGDAPSGEDNPAMELSLEEALQQLSDTSDAVKEKVESGETVLDGQQVEPVEEAPASGMPAAPEPAGATPAPMNGMASINKSADDPPPSAPGPEDLSDASDAIKSWTVNKAKIDALDEQLLVLKNENTLLMVDRIAPVMRDIQDKIIAVDGQLYKFNEWTQDHPQYGQIFNKLMLLMDDALQKVAKSLKDEHTTKTPMMTVKPTGPGKMGQMEGAPLLSALKGLDAVLEQMLKLMGQESELPMAAGKIAGVPYCSQCETWYGKGDADKHAHANESKGKEAQMAVTPTRCNCENMACESAGLHVAGSCKQPAGAHKAKDLGPLCDDCASRMSPQYMLAAKDIEQDDERGREGVDDNAKDVLESYWGEYGEMLTRDIPRKHHESSVLDQRVADIMLVAAKYNRQVTAEQVTDFISSLDCRPIVLNAAHNTDVTSIPELVDAVFQVSDQNPRVSRVLDRMTLEYLMHKSDTLRWLQPDEQKSIVTRAVRENPRLHERLTKLLAKYGDGLPSKPTLDAESPTSPTPITEPSELSEGQLPVEPTGLDRMAAGLKQPKVKGPPDDAVKLDKMKDLASDSIRPPYGNVPMKHTAPVKHGTNLYMEISWDPEDAKLSGPGMRQAIISFVKGLESKKEFINLGITGKIHVYDIDLEAGTASVHFVSSRPGNAPLAVSEI